MARTYLSGDNSRGTEVTAANARYSHLRGWASGVQVEFRPGPDGSDTFDVFMTSGSGGNGRFVKVGTVTTGANGPAWEPAREWNLELYGKD